MLLPFTGRSFIYCWSDFIFHMYWSMYYKWNITTRYYFLTMSFKFYLSVGVNHLIVFETNHLMNRSLSRVLSPLSPAGSSLLVRRSRLRSGTYVFTGGQGSTRSWIVLLRWLPARDHVTMLLAKEKRKSRDANHRPLAPWDLLHDE